jgi:hypothetical protein
VVNDEIRWEGDVEGKSFCCMKRAAFKPQDEQEQISNTAPVIVIATAPRSCSHMAQIEDSRYIPHVVWRDAGAGKVSGKPNGHGLAALVSFAHALPFTSQCFGYHM